MIITAYGYAVYFVFSLFLFDFPFIHPPPSISFSLWSILATPHVTVEFADALRWIDFKFQQRPSLILLFFSTLYRWAIFNSRLLAELIDKWGFNISIDF